MDFDPAEIAYLPAAGVCKVFEASLVQATTESLNGYGHIVEPPETCLIEIVRRPAQAVAQSPRTKAIMAAQLKDFSSSGGREIRYMRKTML
jgi:hypothetical protein